MVQIDTIKSRFASRDVVPPPTATIAGRVQPDDLVIAAVKGWDHGERQVHHVRSVVRTGRRLQLVDDFGLGLSLARRERVLVASRTQKVFWMQKLGRAATAIAREVDRVGGALSALVVGYHQVEGDSPHMELTAWSEIVMVGVSDRAGNPVVDLRRDWVLLRQLEMPRAPVTSVLPANKGIQSALDAERLGKTVRRKSQAYLDPRGASELQRGIAALVAGEARVADVFVWDPQRGRAWGERLRAAGWEVRLETEDGERGGRRLAASPSSVMIFDLDLRPAEALRTARWLHELGPGREVPMVFVDGSDRARQAVRRSLPLGRFCEAHELPHVLASV